MAGDTIRLVPAAAVGAAVLTFIAQASAVSPAGAQTSWTGTPAERGEVVLESFRPDFSSASPAFSGATVAGFLTVQVPVGAAWSVVGDLPFARAAWDVNGQNASSSLVGNPYLGAEWRATPRVTAELGVRLPAGELDELDEPVVDDLGAIVVGMASELERLEAFAPQTLAVSAAASYEATVSGQLSLRVRGGSTFVSGSGTPEDLLVGYMGQLRYRSGPGELTAGITGRANVTDDDVDADRASHQVIAAAAYRVGRVRPGVQLRFPLDGAARELTSFTGGLTLGFVF